VLNSSSAGEPSMTTQGAARRWSMPVKCAACAMKVNTETAASESQNTQCSTAAARASLH
jgi:hypothetical protein